jgi:Ca2+-binding EF-hand superfamily protein
LTNLGEKMSEEEVDELFKSTIDVHRVSGHG